MLCRCIPAPPPLPSCMVDTYVNAVQRNPVTIECNPGWTITSIMDMTMAEVDVWGTCHDCGNERIPFSKLTKLEGVEYGFAGICVQKCIVSWSSNMLLGYGLVAGKWVNGGNSGVGIMNSINTTLCSGRPRRLEFIYRCACYILWSE